MTVQEFTPETLAAGRQAKQYADKLVDSPEWLHDHGGKATVHRQYEQIVRALDAAGFSGLDDERLQ